MPYLERELTLLASVRVIVGLGGFAWDNALRAVAALGVTVPRPRPRFAHGASITLDRWTLLGSYHPSQQNTFTGRLTESMLDDVFERAKRLSATD
jgi:uracil-DNA glycosylase